MKHATKKIRPPLKWHGGKTYLARRIVDLFPEHQVYVEPFLGGGSVLLNKPPSREEVAGDCYGTLINAWYFLQARPAGIYLAGIPYSEKTFDWAVELMESNRVLAEDDSAVAFIVRNRMSRGGLGKDFAWSERLRGGQPGDLNAWKTFINNDLPMIQDRIKEVRFVADDALATIEENDREGAVIYCDPPYLHETRTHVKAYAHEMTREDHVKLLETLKGCKGRVFLSGYANSLYDLMLAGWTRHEFSMPNHSGQGKTKQRRVECVWTNG
jgi:DNA adenine methylase